MKKLSLVTALLAGLTVLPTWAASGECPYTLYQKTIRDARDEKEIERLIKEENLWFDEETPCGGSLMQLAVLRGNPNVLITLLNQDNKRANEVKPIEEFNIPNAPQQLPIILFAAYYAPNASIVNALLSAGADFLVKDEAGRDITWYMDQNPVLRETQFYDDVKKEVFKRRAKGQTQQGISLGDTPAQQQTELGKIPAKVQTGASAMKIPDQTTPKKPGGKVVEPPQS